MKWLVQLWIVFTFILSHISAAEKLPSLEDIINKVKSPTKFLLGKCELDAKIENKKITIDVAVDSCKVNLKELLDHFYPSNKLNEETNNFLVSEVVFLKLEIDLDKKTINFEAKSPTKVDLITDSVLKAKWSISDRFLSIKFNYNKALNYENIGVEMSGKLGIGKQEVLLEFQKKEGEKKMSFKAKTENVEIKLSVKDLVGVIGLEKKVREMFGEETLEKKIVDFAMESVSLEGVFDPATYDIELVASGAVKTDIAKRIKFYFLVIKMQGEPYKIAVVGKVESLVFQKLVDVIVGKKTEIEFLKDKSLDAVIMAATDNIMVLQNKDLTEVIKNLPKPDHAAIPKGPTVVLDFVTTSEEGSKSKESKKQQLYMRYVDKQFQFKFDPTLEVGFVEALNMFLKSTISTELPKWLSEVSGKVKFEKFSFDLAGSINLQLFVPGQVTIGSLIKINDVKFEITRKAVEKTWDFSIQSMTKISKDITLDIGIKKLKDSYQLSGKIPKLKLGELLKYLVSDEKFTTGEFERFNLDLKEITMKWTLPKSEPTAFRLSADVVMAQFSGVKFQLIAVVENKIPDWKMGFYVPKVGLCDMMKDFFKSDLSNACWLKDVDYALSVGAIKKEVKFDLQLLDGSKEGNEGFFFRVKIQFPKDCEGSQMCLKAKEILKKSTKKRSGTKDEIVVLVEGVIRSQNSFAISAKLQLEEKLSANVILNEYSLFIDIKDQKGDFYFGVKVRFDDGDDRFDIIGRIGISTTGDLSLSGRMDGEWKQPFKLKNVVINNLFLKVSINIGVPIPALEFSGKIVIGRPESKKKIDAELALSISLTSITDIYFYSKVSSMTIEEILDLYELKAPNALKDTGFPNGFTIAFSLGTSAKEIPAIGKTVEPGLTIIGDVKLFNVQVSAKIIISTDQPKFVVSIQMNAIKKTFISFTKIKGKKDEGPEFYAELSKDKKEVRINAEVTVLGISVGAVIQVTDTHFEFTVKGKLFGRLEAELMLKAKYGSLEDAEFTVAGNISLKDELKNEIESQIDVAKESTQKVMDETAEALKKIERMGQRQKEAESRYKQRLEDVEKQVAENVEDIKKLEKIKDCVKKCKHVTLGGVVWKENCILVSEVKGKKEYVGCPEWKDDKYSYPDLGCVAECKGESWYEVLWADTKQVAARVSDSIGESIDSAISFFKEVWDKVDDLINEAKSLYEKVKSAVKTGLDILAGAVSDVIKLVGVTEVSFETSLKAAATAEIELAVKVEGKIYKVKASLNGNILKQVAAAVIEHVYSGYGVLKSGIVKAKGYISDVAVKLGIVEKEVAEASKKVEKLGNKRSYVPSRRELEIKRLIYDPLPRPVQNDYATVKVFENFQPERLMKYESIPTVKRYRIEDQRPSRRNTIDALMNSSPCDQLRFVSNGYTKISNILRTLKDAFIQQEKDFRRSVSLKRNRLKKIGMTFRRKCKRTPGCTAKRLEDIFYYLKKARDATTSWVHTVRSKIIRQNKEAFNIWRKNLNAIYRNKRGMSVKEFASELYTTAVSRADTRSMISHEETSGLSMVSQYVHDLFDEERPLTIMEAFPKIAKVNKGIEALRNSPKFTERCENAAS